MRQLSPSLLWSLAGLLTAALTLRLYRRSRRKRYASDRREWWAG